MMQVELTVEVIGIADAGTRALSADDDTPVRYVNVQLRGVDEKIPRPNNPNGSQQNIVVPFDDRPNYGSKIKVTYEELAE